MTRVAGRPVSMALLPVLQLFLWRKAVSGRQPYSPLPQENRLYPHPELASAMKQIKRLQRLLNQEKPWKTSC